MLKNILIIQISQNLNHFSQFGQVSYIFKSFRNIFNILQSYCFVYHLIFIFLCQYFENMKKVNLIAFVFQLSIILYFKQQLTFMKALNNSQNEIHFEEPHQDNLMKKLIELQNMNKEKEFMIEKCEQEIKLLERENNALDEQLELHEKQWKQLQVQLEQEKNEGEEEHEMNNWIENVQKYNGLPQAVIDSLCSMQFEGEQQICLTCYQELTTGVMCTYLPCAHLFHKECIGNYLKVNKWCPACQEMVNP